MIAPSSIDWEEFQNRKDVNGKTYKDMDNSERCKCQFSFMRPIKENQGQQASYMKSEKVENHFNGKDDYQPFYHYYFRKGDIYYIYLNEEVCEQSRVLVGVGNEVKPKAKFLGEKIVKYTKDPKKYRLFAQKGSDEKEANKINVYRILLRRQKPKAITGCLGVYFSKKEREIWSRSKQAKSYGAGLILDEGIDLHKLIDDMQSPKTNISYTTFDWKFYAPKNSYFK